MKDRKATLEALIAVLAMAALWFVTRALWADCDPGVPSMWEYGYNATDEGYYLSGGKEKFVWGKFVELSRGEALNYGFSPGTHWLSYIAHLVFGLSTWTWRIPFFAVNLAAWCALSAFIARRAGALFAFLVCGAMSLSPMIVAYERTASNDVLIGSLLVLAVCSAFSRRKTLLVISAVVTASISLVKPSVWVLVPVVFACAMCVPKCTTRVRDAVLFFLSLAVSLAALKGCVLLSVIPDAAANGCSASEVVKRMTTHYPLPSLFAFTDHFRGLSSFPRDPSSAMMSFFSVLLVPVPLFFALFAVSRRAFGWKHVIYLSLPLYVAAVSVMNTLYTHYFIPVLASLPAVWMLMREDVEEWARENGGKPKAPTVVLFAVSAVAVALIARLLLNPSPISSQESLKAVQCVYSRVYNFPASVVWGYTAPGAVLIALVSTALAAAFTSPSKWKRTLPSLALASLAAGSVVMAFVPASTLAPYMRKFPGDFLAPAALSLAVFLIVTAGSVSFPSVFARKGVWFSLPVLFTAFGILFTPLWRQAAKELAFSRTHRHRDAAEELRKLLPVNAVVIGERSNQMLMSLPVRTATTFAFNSDPIPVVLAMRKKDPSVPLYALVDTQHSYNLDHYRKRQDVCGLETVRKFVMPSFGAGRDSDVYLCRITPPADPQRR